MKLKIGKKKAEAITASAFQQNISFTYKTASAKTRTLLFKTSTTPPSMV